MQTGESLFELTSDMLILEELLASEEATETDIFASLDTYLEDTSRKLDEKVDNYVELIAHFEARYELRMKRANSLLELARRDDAHKELLKERLKQFMSRTGQKRFETDEHEVRLCNNGGKLPVALRHPEADATFWPDALRKTVYKPDMDALREALQSSEHVNHELAAHLAELKERGSHLRIK
jgi:hypothetical protein